MNKAAYPYSESGIYVEPPRNIKKWMEAMRNIYIRSNMIGWTAAYNEITSGWDDMEKRDFKDWMLFYQEGAHNKYKTAQYLSSPASPSSPLAHVENGGGFVPNVDHLRAAFPNREPDMSSFVVTKEPVDKSTEKEQVARKIQSLIGRLNSAEKIFTTPQVQIALKKTLQISPDEWVSLLQKLKREIQLAPMRATSASLIEDIIYKNANQIAQTNRLAGIALLKIAQGLPTPGSVPMAGQPVGETNEAPPGSMIGSPNSMIPAGVDTPENNPVIEFLKNLNGDDVSETDDKEDTESDESAAITVMAQSAPQSTPQSTSPNVNNQVQNVPTGIPSDVPSDVPSDILPQGDIEVSDAEHRDDITFGDPFDRALDNVKISDIVIRLEGIASMFKNRQIARQLSIIDLMMDKIGIAPFFPTLAEAMRSALESNQYCQSRVEEILAKLRGIIVTPMSQHLEGEVAGDSEDAVKEQLAKQEQADKDRKQRRLQEAKEDLDAPVAPVPPTPQTEELSQPAQIQVAPPLRPLGR